MATKRKKLNNKQKTAFSVVAVIIVVLCAVISYLPQLGLPSWSDISKDVAVNDTVAAKDYPFSVHFIDVGQADCALIVSGDDVMLIDAGEVDSFNTIKSYLDSQNITEIDYFVITHAHSDHIGSADEVLENYKVDNVIMTKLTEEQIPTSDVYKNLISALSQSSAKIIAAKPENNYTLDNFSFTILAPVKDTYDNLNNTSVVVKVKYQNNTFLFQGDAEKESENDILDENYNVSADVIKIGHHGSSTSSKKAYLTAVNPQLAVISCGVDNSYNHPSAEVIERLEKLNIPYKRTDVNGTVVVASDGNNLSVMTQR